MDNGRDVELFTSHQNNPPFSHTCTNIAGYMHMLIITCTIPTPILSANECPITIIWMAVIIHAGAYMGISRP